MQIITDFKYKFTKLIAILCMATAAAGNVQAESKYSKGIEATPTIENFNGKNCWVETAEKYKAYGIDVYLLFAIGMVESQLNPSAKGVNTNGSYDYGIMQINSSWYPKLEKMGIPRSMLGDGCTSIQVGAWILAHNFYKMGHRWEAIGAYNAVSRSKQWVYARKVYAMYDMLKLWSQKYQEMYSAQFNGATPAYVPKPPQSWILYAYNSIK